MFPGDTETKYFCVKAHLDADLELLFRTKITGQTKNLGDVLHIKVTHLETGKVLCDAPFAEIDGKEFSELLKKNVAGETTAYYQIDVSLDTSVGNEYQAAELKADLRGMSRMRAADPTADRRYHKSLPLDNTGGFVPIAARSSLETQEGGAA